MLDRNKILGAVPHFGGGECWLGGAPRLWRGERVFDWVCRGLQREGRVALAMQIRNMRFFIVLHAHQ